jgi:hypothetical protein
MFSICNQKESQTTNALHPLAVIKKSTRDVSKALTKIFLAQKEQIPRRSFRRDKSKSETKSEAEQSLTETRKFAALLHG